MLDFIFTNTSYYVKKKRKEKMKSNKFVEAEIRNTDFLAAGEACLAIP